MIMEGTWTYSTYYERTNILGNCCLLGFDIDGRCAKLPHSIFASPDTEDSSIGDYRVSLRPLMNRIMILLCCFFSNSILIQLCILCYSFCSGIFVGFRSSMSIFVLVSSRNFSCKIIMPLRSHARCQLFPPSI